ncbi:unnamed protein product [Parnassius apollo]|uniref:(apollo) hypothetical protein n=1 Tax=Parnassius apollo TaxID=110799 RepID=A0A8S3W361_PARAO|nr:unnamed protein product [Parnassius apollo]
MRKEVEILGVPKNYGENQNHTILVAEMKVGVDLKDKDLDWVTRVGPRRPPKTVALPEDSGNMPRPVVVKFLRQSKRDQIPKVAKLVEKVVVKET